MPKDKKIFYYDDELNDDFAGTKINTCCVDEKFPYLRGGFLWRMCSFLLYYPVVVPLVWFYMRVILRVRFVNRKAVKRCGKTPYFLYGNHTGYIDAFTPNLISLPRRNRIVVGADTVSIKGLRTIVQMLGALPLPTELRGTRHFSQALSTYHKKDNVTIYPEAHIWPYYNGVRAFTDASFGYPVKHGSPVIAFFTAYTKPKGFLAFFRKANITVYISDPIFPDEGLPYREARKSVRDQVYAFMQDKVKYSDYEVVNYVKRTQKSETAV